MTDLMPELDQLPAGLAEQLKFDNNGLLCAVVQDAATDRVLMVAWMDAVALARTLNTGRAWYWSRSRQEYWRKGDTSGAIQEVKSVELDCDGDAVLLRVTQHAGACHTGKFSCFDAGGPISLQLK
ncbi:MAG: phosphoribosyl-AMP cyclohydrolase [Trueperella sp.]|nr:phosphoribosyl-AMP cyclohydrolase [Trueperella sp.]